MSVWERYISNFISYLKIEKGLADNSLFAYQSDVEKLQNYTENLGLNPLEINLDQLQNFVNELHDLGMAARSQARIISGIKQFFNFLILENEIDYDPCELLEMPKIAMKLPEVMTLEEIESLIAGVDLEKTEGFRNRAIIETLYSCGLRVSELINLKFSDIYYDEGFVRVLGKGSKQRLVPLSEQVISEIEVYKTNVRNKQSIKPGFENFIFLNRRGAKLTREMIFIIVKELALRVNLKKDISPHSFRHSFATHLIEGGANLRAIQEMLGHESITTTEIYTHLDQRFLREAILKYHPRNM